jgi:fructosamine-3-kinase
VIDPQPDLKLTVPQAERVLGAWLGESVVCSEISPLQGGMVNSVFRLGFDRQPHSAVVKLHGPERNTFASEALALRYLRTETTCPVPAVYLQDSSAELIPYAFLLLEHMPGVCLKDLDLDPSQRSDIDAQLGEILAELHNHRGTRWGPIGDVGEWASWADLFAARLVESRADPRVAQRLSSELLHSVDRAVALARSALKDAGEPTLVLGDVWDGNLMVSAGDHGRLRLTGVLDPDLQFADVEYELAYLEVFDAQRDAFFGAYTQHHPLRPGYEHRRLFYWLHTALVHVALFGDEFFCDFTARTAGQICDID